MKQLLTVAVAVVLASLAVVLTAAGSAGAATVAAPIFTGAKIPLRQRHIRGIGTDAGVFALGDAGFCGSAVAFLSWAKRCARSSWLAGTVV